MVDKTSIERIAQLTKFSEDPLEKLKARANNFDKTIGMQSSTERLMRELQSNDTLIRLENALSIANQHSVLFDAAKKLMEMPLYVNQLTKIAERTGHYSRLFDQAVLPDHSHLAEIAQKMADRITSFEVVLANEQSWAARLAVQMDSVRHPWVFPEHAALSFEGFAVVSRLNDVVRYAEPFGEFTREIINDDLGAPIDVNDGAEADERDAAHVDAGINPGILAIPETAMGDVLIQTGFVFRAEYTPVPPTTDGSNHGHIYHPGHAALITAVEQNLRNLIVAKMVEFYGINWMHSRMSGAIVAGWQERHDEAVAAGEASLDLIQYSNFMELKDIIIGRQHWKEIFSTTFSKKEHFATSMERLHPIRLPLAHSRPIGVGQQIHLISESGLLLRALGIDIFRK
ncbi:hypothetical protein [Cochlodiniinecator piscidefendens]|uniref:hypothetical protein n=1 Tax=Cochlodiniinecator piscidefendens TaxID=2715756 RepID=UPI00140A29D8|nr:hypothetical protein [Cochlodiniinecator piscidefendens]